MADATQASITPTEYLRHERLAESKSELINGEIYAMAGASRAHVVVNLNVAVALSNRLRSKPCQPFNQDMRLRVDHTGLYTYPDVVVACPPLQFDDDQQDTLLNPVVVVEVLSPSTESYDRGEKFAHYRTLPSLRDYVLVCQDKARIEHYARQTDDSWLLRVAEGPQDYVALHSINCTLKVAEVYERIDFAECQPEATTD